MKIASVLTGSCDHGCIVVEVRGFCPSKQQGYIVISLVLHIMIMAVLLENLMCVLVVVVYIHNTYIYVLYMT
jgi:hypothetical protein